LDQNTYSEYRINGDFSVVAAGIRNISDARRKFRSRMKLEIQFLVNKYNEHQIPMAKSFARETGADLKLKSMQVISTSSPFRWMPANKRYSRYERIDGREIIKNRMPDRCGRLWLNPVVTWDGKVIPCCFDKDAEFIMGDLNRESFRSIWNSQRYYEFRKMILSGRNKINICMNCTSGLRGVRF
jgi:radical SAM protein with 4Fe4S-binding SPASM domain